jgi:hypothetical protein
MEEEKILMEYHVREQMVLELDLYSTIVEMMMMMKSHHVLVHVLI